MSVHHHGYLSLHLLVCPPPSWYSQQSLQLSAVHTSILWNNVSCNMKKSRLWRAMAHPSACSLHPLFLFSSFPSTNRNFPLACISVSIKINWNTGRHVRPTALLNFTVVWCQIYMWHNNTICTVSYYERVFIHLFHSPAWYPCLIYQASRKQVTGKHHGEPYLPLQHKPSIPQISVSTSRVFFSLLISTPLLKHDALPFQFWHGFWELSLNADLFFAVFWQTTSKEKWILILLCVR